MSIDRLNEMIDKALSEGTGIKDCMNITKALNADHALGEYHGLMSVIEEMYGIDEMLKTHDRVQAKVDELFKIVETAYKGV